MGNVRSTPHARRSIAATVVASTVLLVAGPASSAEPQPTVVATTSSGVLPRLVSDSSVSRPHVDALAAIGDVTYAGGSFARVEQGGTGAQRANLMAFDRETGELSDQFAPAITGGQVWALAADPETASVYVGGRFTKVDGVARAALVKLDATTGAVDTGFWPRFRGGQVNDLELVDVGGVAHLVVVGSAGEKVMSLDPATGLSDGWITSSVTEQLPGSWGKVSGYSAAVDPSSTHLAVTGNFLRVDGQPRSKFFMLDLSAETTSLSPWYYPGFAKPCASEHPAQDRLPAGCRLLTRRRCVTVTATGQIPETKADVWHHALGDANPPDTTVCDGVGRFSLADPSKPQWINYTGGDSVWSVSDTGAAVYVPATSSGWTTPTGTPASGSATRRRDSRPSVAVRSAPSTRRRGSRSRGDQAWGRPASAGRPSSLTLGACGSATTRPPSTASRGADSSTPRCRSPEPEPASRLAATSRPGTAPVEPAVSSLRRHPSRGLSGPAGRATPISQRAAESRAGVRPSRHPARRRSRPPRLRRAQGRGVKRIPRW